MAEVVNDLVTRFGFSGSTAPLDKFNDTLSGSIVLIGGMVTGLAVATGAMFAWANSNISAAESLYALQASSGVAIETIQELSYAATQNQSSIGAMHATISSLSSAIGAASLNGSDDFARLGISVRDSNGYLKTADVILGEVRQRFAAMNLTMREQESLAGALGIDSSLLIMLNKTSGEMSAMRDRARELGLITSGQAGASVEYRQSLDSLWFSLDAVKSMLSAGMAPQMERIAEKMTDLLVANKELISDGLKSTMEWVEALAGSLLRLSPILLTVTGLIVAMSVATKKNLAVIAITSMLALVDDLIVAMEGGKSVVAEFFDQNFSIDIGKMMSEWAVKIKQAAVDMNGILKELLADTIISYTSWLTSVISDIISSSIAAIGGAYSKLTSDQPSAIPPAFSGPGQAASGTINRTDARSVSLSVTQNITTADPVEAGRQATSELQRQINNAQLQISAGVR